MIRRVLRTTSVGLMVTVLVALGCEGGSLEETSSGGSNSGSSGSGSSSGGSNSGSSGSGNSGSGGSGQVCCLAIATCGPDETELSAGEACPAGAVCEDRTICCQTIRCATSAATCDAIAVCDAGDTTLEGACPPNQACYARSLCGSTVYCLDTQCDPATEGNRKYMGDSPSKCALIDFVCPAGTIGFSNSCGCGCEQPQTCPSVVDCMPGGATSPMCADSTQCPYTLRAL